MIQVCTLQSKVKPKFASSSPVIGHNIEKGKDKDTLQMPLTEESALTDRDKTKTSKVRCQNQDVVQQMCSEEIVTS